MCTPPNKCCMLRKKSFKQADYILFVAAVTDYTPASTAAKKMPKVKETIKLTLKPTADIAATLCKQKKKNQVTIGFALETHDGPRKAKSKMQAKNLDGIILNGMEAFGRDTGKYDFIQPGSGRQV